jgi:uncharacterized phage protein gp47/JayE
MYKLPTINELAELTRSAFRRNLKGSDAWLWPNNIYATAKVLAGACFEILGFASYISRQKFAVTAPDIESLRLHGEEFGIPQKPAAPAVGVVAVVASAALSVDVNAVFRRGDGVEFLAVRGGALTGAGTLHLDVVAAVDGKAGNAAPGTSLAMVSGWSGSGAPTAAVDTDGIAFGSDLEDIESYRARILFRKRNPPHGGAASDYVMWASEVAGVSRVFVERLWAGPGTVRVFFLMDDAYPGGVPTVTDVARVRDHLDALQPAGAKVMVAAPTPRVINVTIAGLAPDTTAVREAVLAELRDLFLRRSRVAGIDQPHSGMPFLASPEIFSRSWIWQAIANAAGEDRHVLQSPAGDTVLATAEIPVLGTVTFL